jgi:hypothetical protein
LYSLDEIISSVSVKPVGVGLGDSASDEVDPVEYMRRVFNTINIRAHMTIVPLAELRILQPEVEMWRYLRLCLLGRSEFNEFVARKPLVVVRGRAIQGYPLLQGNHRALYALMHNISELPATVYVLQDEDAALAFAVSAAALHAELDRKYGSHGVSSLREAYKRLLAAVVELRKGKERLKSIERAFTTRSPRYRALRDKNEEISARIPCISVEGYIQTMQKGFGVKRSEVSLTEERAFFRGLVLTQGAVEKEKLARIAADPELLHAPILLVRTRLVDYVAVGHTRLRALIERGEKTANTIVIHEDNDPFNRFLDRQARQARFLTGNEGIRRLELIE